MGRSEVDTCRGNCPLGLDTLGEAGPPVAEKLPKTDFDGVRSARKAIRGLSFGAQGESIAIGVFARALNASLRETDKFIALVGDARGEIFKFGLLRDSGDLRGVACPKVDGTDIVWDGEGTILTCFAFGDMPALFCPVPAGGRVADVFFNALFPLGDVFPNFAIAFLAYTHGVQSGASFEDLLKRKSQSFECSG